MKEIIWATIAAVLFVVGIAAYFYSPQPSVVATTTTLPPKTVETTKTETPEITETTRTITQTAVQTVAPTAPKLKIEYNEELAKKGIEYFKELGCVACHTARAVGVEVGGNLGPDLSIVLLGNVGVERGTAGGPIMMKYFEKHGLKDPVADPQKAAELVAKFLAEGDKELAPTMSTQIDSFRKLYGDDWVNKYIPALIEMFKMAATK